MIQKIAGDTEDSRKTVTITYHLDREYTFDEINAMIAEIMARCQ